jgi:hypothetical protein
MKRSMNGQTALTAASGLLLGALVVGGAAQAITESAFRYSDAQTGYLSIPAAGFVSLASTYAYPFDNFVDLRPTTNNGICFGAPVNLPQGAKMSKLAAWYGNSGGTLSLRMLRRGPEHWFDQIATVSLPNTGSIGVYTMSTTNIQKKEVVDNRHFSYHLEYCAIGMNTVLAKVRVTYTYESAGD